MCFCKCSLRSPRTSSLPPLDWPLPSQYNQYELKIEVHPKAHHRAHYETEGSRGAVKAASGGHPVVKVSRHGNRPPAGSDLTSAVLDVGY
ncbi:nuclear factor of activated T-cells, cytoplasmic 3 isoform X1 [Tachysurus ichikawai]